MAWALDEFFATLESEFDVEIPASERERLETPGDVVDWLVEHSTYGGGGSDEARRDEIAEAVGEVMAETLGVTRYREASRFIQDLKVR